MSFTNGIVITTLIGNPNYVVNAPALVPYSILIEPNTPYNIVTSLTGPRGPVGPSSFPPQLGLFLAWDVYYPSHYNLFTYSAGTLTAIDIYADNTLAVHIFNKNFTYSAGTLIQELITHIPDGKTETRTFTYSSGTLVNIQYTQT